MSNASVVASIEPCPVAGQACWEVVSQEAESWTPEKILRWADKTFADNVAIASAFGVEGIVMIDIASKVWSRLRVFVLDTGFLFPETYRLIEQIESRYDIAIERIMPDDSPRQPECRPELWRHDPDRCCRIRKIDPLRNKLARLNAWVTSIRRDQTPERSGVRKVQWDEKFHLVKINPLADWSSEQVWTYVRSHHLPYNPLHDRHYPSIGCIHCTRAVKPGEDPRAGRWPGFAKRECGLHTPDSSEQPSSTTSPR